MQVAVIGTQVVACGVQALLEPYSPELIVDDLSAPTNEEAATIFVIGPRVRSVHAMLAINRHRAPGQPLRIARLVDPADVAEFREYPIVVDHEIPLSVSGAELARQLMRLANASSSVADHLRFPLSQRQCEVLAMVVDGASNRRIASELDISNHTVKSHMSSVLAKLKLRSRTAAAIWARH